MVSSEKVRLFPHSAKYPFFVLIFQILIYTDTDIFVGCLVNEVFKNKNPNPDPFPTPTVQQENVKDMSLVNLSFKL